MQYEEAFKACPNAEIGAAVLSVCLPWCGHVISVCDPHNRFGLGGPKTSTCNFHFSSRTNQPQRSLDADTWSTTPDDQSYG